MSYDNPRLTLTDNAMTAIIKLSDGNPGACNVLAQMVKRNPVIDPDDAFGSFGPLHALDTLDIYGSRIWMLYKDACDQSLGRTLGAMRCVQMGILSDDALTQAVDNDGFKNGELDAALLRLKEELPAFQVEAV